MIKEDINELLSISTIISSIGYILFKSVPNTESSGNSKIPVWSLPIPNSSVAQSIPWLNTPAIFFSVIVKPETIPPTFTKAHLSPTLTFGAPHKIS